MTLSPLGIYARGEFETSRAEKICCSILQSVLLSLGLVEIEYSSMFVVCLFPSRIQIQLEGKDFRKLNETPGNKNLRIARCAQNPKQEGFTEAVKRRYIHETEFTL